MFTFCRQILYISFISIVRVLDFINAFNKHIYTTNAPNVDTQY